MEFKVYAQNRPNPNSRAETLRQVDELRQHEMRQRDEFFTSPASPPSPPVYKAYIRPNWFIQRDNGTCVPVIPVDELPSEIELEGAPRNLQMDDAQGMKFLGRMPYNGQTYTFTRNSRIRRHTQQHWTDSQTSLRPLQLGSVARPDSSGSSHGAQPRTPPRRATEKPQGEDSMAFMNAITKRDPDTTTASMPQQRPLPPSGKEPDQSKKEYCTYWIKTGECDFTQQGCLFKHEMPDLRTLRTKIGINAVPHWYSVKMAIARRTGGASPAAASGGRAGNSGVFQPPTWLQQRVMAADRCAIASTAAGTADVGASGDTSVEDSDDEEEPAARAQQHGRTPTLGRITSLPIRTAFRAPDHHVRHASEGQSTISQPLVTELSDTGHEPQLIDFSVSAPATATNVGAISPPPTINLPPTPPIAAPAFRQPTPRTGTPSSSRRGIFVPSGETPSPRHSPADSRPNGVPPPHKRRRSINDTQAEIFSLLRAAGAPRSPGLPPPLSPSASSGGRGANSVVADDGRQSRAGYRFGSPAAAISPTSAASASIPAAVPTGVKPRTSAAATATTTTTPGAAAAREVKRYFPSPLQADPARSASSSPPVTSTTAASAARPASLSIARPLKRLSDEDPCLDDGPDDQDAASEASTASSILSAATTDDEQEAAEPAPSPQTSAVRTRYPVILTSGAGAVKPQRGVVDAVGGGVVEQQQTRGVSKAVVKGKGKQAQQQQKPATASSPTTTRTSSNPFAAAAAHSTVPSAPAPAPAKQVGLPASTPGGSGTTLITTSTAGPAGHARRAAMATSAAKPRRASTAASPVELVVSPGGNNAVNVGGGLSASRHAVASRVSGAGDDAVDDEVPSFEPHTVVQARLLRGVAGSSSGVKTGGVAAAGKGKGVGGGGSGGGGQKQQVRVGKVVRKSVGSVGGKATVGTGAGKSGVSVGSGDSGAVRKQV